MAAPHAFLDILANPQVRDAYLAGRISIILSNDLETILWANGAGARFLGFRTVADSIGVDSGFDNLTRLQIENGLTTKRGVKIGGIPNAQSFLVNAIEMDHLNSVVFLRSIAAVASDGGFVDLTDGLGDEFTEAAVLDISGNILSSTTGFRSDFVVDDELITLLYEAQSGNIIKKRLLKNYSDMPVGILELNKQPAIFLLIAAKRDDENIDNADEVKQDFVFDITRFPSRFAWQVDENSFFTDVSPELEICVGPRFGDIIDKSFTSLAKEWNMDSNGAMRALLKSHKAWSERKIYWPVEGGETRVEIEFSALPIYSRNREFSGYRGFGIINEAKMTAKDEGLNLARNRGPKGLTAQEHEAFTTIARKLKADILAVELPRNLRLAQSDDYQKLSSGKNSIIENVASDVEIGRAKASKADSDATIENKSISHQPNSDQPDNNHENDYEKDIAQEEKPLADKTPSLDALPQSEEDEVTLASKNDFDDSSDRTNDTTETLEDSISDQPQNLTEAVEEETNNLPKFSQLPTLDEEYAFSNDDEELVSQADDSAIDSLLNHYDKSTLTGNKDAKLDDSDILPKLPERTAHTPQIATPMVVQLSKEDNLAMTELPDDDLETALEQEWANDDDLIGEPLKDKSDLQNDKDNDALTSMSDDNADNIDSFELKDNLPLHENGEDTGRDQETNNALNGKKLDKDDEKLNAESDLAIDVQEEEEEPQTIEEALAALRRSLEANGIEAVEPRKEEVLDFWDEERSDSVETEDQLAEQASVENLAPNIDELMRQATFSDDENRTAPAVLPVIDSNDEVIATDDHPPFLYPESERGPVALDNEETDEPESNVGRLNLRPADKLEIFSNDGDNHADNTARSGQDGALPIIPSPRIEFTLLQHLPLPILIYRDNRVLFASDELLQLTGFPTLDSFRAHGILSVILREWLPRNILIGSNDEIWSVRPKMRGVTWADGREASMISFGNLEKQDSIDREDFEALQRKAVELSILLNLISDGVLILDDTGLIHSVNEAAQRMFGLDADDIKGRNFIQFFSYKSVDTVNQYFDTVRQSDDKLTFGEGYEVEARRGDGDSISLFVSFGKMELDEGYFLMLRDLSVIHSAASELVVARHQAEEEALRKSRYLALVSHEIRTPLNAIIGLSELILEEKFGSLNNDRYRGYLRDIVTSGGHIMTLINDLLDAAKVAEGRTTINIGTVSIVPILKEVLGLMTPQANTGRIIMRSNIAHDLPNIAADKRSVKQIILNLLSNAIRFTPPGGQIIVSALRHENAGVLLRVRDSGIGMNENEMEEAMLPFHQISRPIHSDDDSENGNRGTGLGLPLTKALADANNARFNLYSETGKGTVAEIIFPLAVNYLDDEPIDN
ncbi:ATP-binding protein [Bartonella sp. HY329]|uniref:ATP-binding protein n=1 Tax=unclassified Bartonella TaxID=2645622 RepID=UPI0021C60DBA|nr:MULTISPECIES: ATP-binding protein [unclassified Bartonella]UXM95872.1 ATP-binding protein [Bartonella sp. HY329]UXN10197.1 ATP-binding protein [Bartonella sp. HY328]